MTPVTSLILILLAIVLSVVFGRKHANMGLIALGLAYLLGCFVLGFRANALYALFPAKVILQFIFISYFYGILIENGTIQWIAEKASYYARNTSFLIPIIIFVLCLLLSIAGVPPVSVAAAVAPLFLAVADKMRLNKLLILLSIHTGQCAGCGSPVSGVAIVAKGIMGDTLGADAGLIWNQFMLNYILVYTIVFILCYLAFRGWRSGRATEGGAIEDPGAPTGQQVVCIIMAVAAMIFLIVPSLLSTFTDIAVMKFISSKADPGFVYLILGIVCMFLRYGDERTIITRRVPWGLVLVIGGMAILIGMLGLTGATDYLSNLLVTSVHDRAIAPALAGIGGFLSMFSDSLGAVIPLLASMIPSIITSNPGLSGALLLSAACIGTMMTGFAPFSTGGSLLLSFIGEEERNKYFILQLISTIVMLAVPCLIFALQLVLM